ncbi:MAG TPA: thioredoxin family protein [Candidatus Eisenbacteria bacterium]|nr:thioredoxin family protein [Candidatus Eisenbacteria bacterium]
MSASPSVKKSFVIGAAAAAGLVIMAAIVNQRLGGVDMPLKGLENMNASSFGTPEQLTKRVMDAEGGANAEVLPVLAQTMPEFTDIKAWLNSPPLAAAGLKGKVVLVDFWTYSCINCIRTLPYVTSWHEKYKDKGFTVIGVHTPEFAFEKIESNVRDAIERHHITYPVAMDNDYGTWNAYNNQYWPAEYLFDAQGRLRHVNFGEGEYDVTERDIQLLLEEQGAKVDEGMTKVPSDVDFSQIGTPETYLGYGRAEYFGSPEPVKKDAPQTYSAPSAPRDGLFYLFGTWTIEEERAVLDAASGGIVYRYQASNANLVMGSAKGAVSAEVTLDGAPVPAGLRGADIVERDGKTYVEVSAERLYSLIDARGDYSTRTLRIRFLDAGVQAYAFTFG